MLRSTTRTGKFNQQYQVTELANGLTEIQSRNNRIVVEADYNKVIQGWYNWNMLGQQIQTAFSFLSPDEREFILTGITKNEWNQLFANKEEN